MKKLTSQEIVNIADNIENIILIAPDETAVEIYGVWYKESTYVFRKSFTGAEKELILDTSGSDFEVYEDNDAIYFRVDGDMWILKALDFDYFVKRKYNEEEALDAYQAKLCLQRAQELETYLNKELFIPEDSEAKIVVQLRVNVEYEGTDDPEYFYPCFYHYFEAFVVDGDGNSLTSGSYLFFDSTNEDALRCLAHGLVRNISCN